MKLLSKISMVVMALAMTFAFSSCDKDLCYSCVGFDDGAGNSLEDLGTVCEGDNGATEDEVKDAVDLYEALGGTCTKQ